MATSLRSNDHGISGSSSPLPDNVLPTKLQVLKGLQLSKENLVSEGKTKIPVKDIIKPVLSQLLLVWNSASIPTITYRGVERALHKLWESMRDANKNESNRKRWEGEKDLLFDICPCKCPQIACSEFSCMQDLTMTNEQLTSLKDSPLDVPAYPCHTQAVERANRLVTEASSSVNGHEAREGFIRQRILARKSLKGHASKKDYFARLEGNTDE